MSSLLNREYVCSLFDFIIYLLNSCYVSFSKITTSWIKNLYHIEAVLLNWYHAFILYSKYVWHNYIHALLITHIGVCMFITFIFCYPPPMKSGGDIVLALSVCPSISPFVHTSEFRFRATSQELLMAFQWNFTGVITMKPSCASDLRRSGWLIFGGVKAL